MNLSVHTDELLPLHVSEDKRPAAFRCVVAFWPAPTLVPASLAMAVPADLLQPVNPARSIPPKVSTSCILERHSIAQLCPAAELG